MSFFKTLIGLNALEEQEAQRRADVDRYGQDLEKDNQLRNQQQEIARLRNEANAIPAPSGREMDLERKVQELGDIENLLARPMKEIAERNALFKHTYMKQQELLSNWMVSQKAFHEIAFRYGKALGKSVEEISAEVRQAEVAVIEGRVEFSVPMGPMAKEALGYGARHAAKVGEEANEKRKKFLKIQRAWLADFGDIEKQRQLSKEEADKRDSLIKEISDVEAKLAMLPVTPDPRTKSAFSYIEEMQAETNKAEAEELERKRTAQRNADEDRLKNIEKSLENWTLVERQRELTSEDKEKIERLQTWAKELRRTLGLV
ncbi:hypothetical protein [Herbaspirillum sp.]|uniref:hypothetical protein n=1 Tax=Herbaspirillum sp. TaxID=1890675 RepID=UPI0031DDE680